MKIKTLLSVFFLLTLSCGHQSSESAIDACPIDPGNPVNMATALSTITTIENAAEVISNTLLTVPGDSYLTSGSGYVLTVKRAVPNSLISFDPISIGSFTGSASFPASLTSLSGATTLDYDMVTFDPNPLSDFYAPTSEWNSEMAAYRIVDSAAPATPLSSLNSLGSPADIIFPCDTSSCTTDCSCRCYRWNFAENTWTTDDITTSALPASVSCNSYLPAAYVSVFAVKSGCE